MISKDLGAVSAYGMALDGGLDPEISKQEYAELLASYGTVAQEAADSASRAAQAANATGQLYGQTATARDAAISAKNDAVSAKDTAAEAANVAGRYEAQAESAKTDAESARDTAVNAVDGFAAGAQQALDSVNEAGGNWKSLAEKQAGNSEAWAVGQRGGSDVPTTDATYHNNAKYYAEAAATDRTTAQTAATNASQSATAAATSASAAAESARTLTIDATLTQSGQAADAKETGDEITSLKSDLNAQIELSRFTTYRATYGVGALSLFTGFARGSLTRGVLDTAKPYRVSSCDVIHTTKAITLNIANGFKIDRHVYVNGQYSTSSGWQTGSITIPADRYFKVIIARSTEDTSEIANVNEFVSAIAFELAFQEQISTNAANISDLQDDVEGLQDVILIKSDNLYNPALQTQDTISPHYYFQGVPYSTTQFDNVWNCTALIEIEPNTTYTLGLVPDIGGVTKPWNTASAGGFCYDSTGSYISGSGFTSNTFTTPATAKYIRFNYQITNGFSLTELNARCVLVKGGTLPETYEAYVDTTLVEYVRDLNSKVEETDSRVQSVQPLWYKRTSTTIEISYAYSSTKDIVVTMQKFGGNDLFDIKSVDTITKSADPATAERTRIWSNPSDAFSPYVVAAVNNIDGDSQTVTFTGGQHQYNNTGSGSTPTARTVSISFYADKREVSDGETGNATHFHIVWENRVQGYNTKKSDGTGREILKVIHTADFNGEDIKVSTNIYPLEDVKMTTFYGFQFYAGSLYPDIRYFDSANRLVNTIDGSSSLSSSGDLVGYSFQAANITNGDCAQVSIDPLFDLGKRDYATGQNAMFVSYNKVYFSIVRNETSMSSGSLYSLKGAYKFEPVTV